MSKTALQKLKLLYLAKIFTEQTDEEHSLTVAQIIKQLSVYGIAAERRTVYDDIKHLQNFGMDIICIKSRMYHYFLGQRNFELPELKLLADAVQNSHFITYKKSAKLIQKLSSLASKNQAKELQRQSNIYGRSKVDNETIYYNVDCLQAAIIQRKQVRFYYFDYTPDKLQKLRNDGNSYIVSPYALTWSNENYYAVTYYEKYTSISHFRVDRMMDVEITDIPCSGKETFDHFDLARHTKRTFGMFSGTERNVKMRFHNSLVNSVLDRFGQDVSIIRNDHEYFHVSVSVVPSPAFYGWIFQFGDKASIISPDAMKEEMIQMCREILNSGILKS